MAIRVLLVDDHAVVRDGLRLMLEAEPDVAVVGEAAGGRQAVRCVRKISPDVVVMDVAMPELNGIEAARQISQGYPDTRIVILSMHATAEYIYQALQAGADGYVVKEAAGREVVRAVHRVYAGRRFLSDKITATVVDDYMRQRLPQERNPLERLSCREWEVLQLVVEGKTSAEIGEDLHLSPKTVETYRSRMMHKLGVDSLPDLVKFAIRHGLTSVD